MLDSEKTREQLIHELDALRQRVTELEAVNTKLQETEVLLQQAEAEFQGLFEAAGDSVFIIDPLSLQILDANDHAARRLGYSHEELLRLTLENIEVLTVDQQHETPAWESTISGTQIYECSYQHKDGSRIASEVSSRLVTFSDREIMLNFVRDITPRKSMEQQRLELALEQERMQIHSNFIANASHEFKTPLSIIKTSGYLLGKISNPDEQKQHIDLIIKQVSNITSLVNSMITMSRLDSGHHDVAEGIVDLNDMIRSIDQVLQPAIQQKNLTVTLEYSEQALPVQIDSGYLRESISRIWRNAIRHTPDGGSIMIRSNSTEGMAVFEITDTGVGISEEDLPRIFERFFRTDEAGTTRGFGLGLPIARAIIERHHGRIEVESQVGQGSTFRVFLPLDRGN